jgi:hypothetical protein
MPEQTAPLFGYLGTLRFFIEAEGGEDDYLYRRAVDSRSDIEGGIRTQVAETLGNEVQVVEVHFEKGSLTVAVIFGAIGTIYVTMSQYDDFLKGVNKATQQLGGFFSRFFGGGTRNVRVAGSWIPSPVVTTAHQTLSTPRQPFDVNLLMIAYLIVSNAALLGTLIWLLLRPR